MEIVSHFSQLIYQEKIPNNLADTLKNLINTQKEYATLSTTKTSSPNPINT